jgi:hypothetical protein
VSIVVLPQNIPKLELRVLKKGERKSFSRTIAGEFEKEVHDYFQRSGYTIDASPRGIDLLVSKGKEIFAVELKLYMGWNKACEAQWQINIFKNENKKLNVTGYLVIFKEFNNDWGKKPKYLNQIEKGWPLWYRDHSESGLIHLLKYEKGTFLNYSDVISNITSAS